MPVGDRLARGDASAQFTAGAGLSDFQHDLAVRPEIVSEKYGLSPVEVAQYQVQRERGEALPDLPAVDHDEPQDIAGGVSVVDKRHTYDSKPVAVQEPKYPPKEYEAFTPILDRVLVKRIPDDPNMELLEDGSLRDKRTGFVIPGKYRQHSNVGIVLATGNQVVLGGFKLDMSDVVRPGDKVIHGEYNAEKVILPKEMVHSLCDALEIDYGIEEELNLVRVQDIRGVYKTIKPMSKFKTFFVNLRALWLSFGT